MKTLLLAFQFVVVFLIKSCEQVQNFADKQPNIIYILSDDLGYSDVGFTNGFIETPNLNRLVSEGKQQVLLTLLCKLPDSASLYLNSIVALNYAKTLLT